MVALESFSFLYSCWTLIILGTIILLYLGKRYFGGAYANIKRDLTNKIVVVTGSNTGIGKITALELAKMNATVIVACRDLKKGKEAVEEIKQLSKNEKVDLIQLDLSNLSSVREFAKKFHEKYNKLDILINNAGVMAPANRELTKDGFELQFGTNHLGHFLLTELLMDSLKRAAPARIVSVSSNGALMFGAKINFDDLNFENTPYFPFTAYGQSKLANILFTQKLQDRYEKDQITAVCLHPGGIRTELTRHYLDKPLKKVFYFLVYPLWWYVSKSPLQGAQTTLYCALQSADKLQGGAYYDNCHVSSANKKVQNKEVADRLWVESYKLVNHLDK